MSNGLRSEWSVAVAAAVDHTMTAAIRVAALRAHALGVTMSQDRQRRSAKTVITDMANEMLYRTTDPDLNIKLNLLQTISAKMGWNDLFERLRNRDRYRADHVVRPEHKHIEGSFQIGDEPAGQPEKWFQK